MSAAQNAAKKRVNVLLVEDDVGDVELAEEAVRQGNVSFKLSVVEDGVQAMRYLRREDPFTEVGRPDLLVLDLNLPKKNGREVLADLKADPALRTIPVILLSTSAIQEDIIQTYGLDRRCCYTKPFRFDDFIKVMQSIESWYLEQAQAAKP
jgi:two-component system, chemotaxis family, response regulator Rcp1